jgi:RNA polymerase sigma-70 factor, ECF subfamily
MADLSEIEAAIPSLRRYAWSLLRNAAEADDLVQDCLVHAVAGYASWRGGEVRPWLFTIMHNLHVSRWRRLRRSPFVAADEKPDPAWHVAAVQPLRAELQDTLAAIGRLPEESRQILLLVGVEEFDYATAARILGVPVGTVMSRLSRARDRLRQLTAEPERRVLRRVK